MEQEEFDTFITEYHKKEAIKFQQQMSHAEIKPYFPIYHPTRLDYFAGQALQGLCASEVNDKPENIVKGSIKIAKELIKQLEAE